MRLKSFIRNCAVHVEQALSGSVTLTKRNLDARRRGFIVPRSVLALGLAALVICGALLARRPSDPNVAVAGSASQPAKHSVESNSSAHLVPMPASGQTMQSGPLKISLAPAPLPKTQPRVQALLPSPAQPSLAKLDAAFQPGATTQVKYGNIPMSFEANRGQAGPNVRYEAHGSGYQLSLEPSGATLSLAVPPSNGQTESSKPAEAPNGPADKRKPEQTRYSELKLDFVGANAAPSAEGLG